MIGMNSSLNRKVHVPFGALVNSLVDSMPSERAVLLLYSFLQSHPTFLEIVVNQQAECDEGRALATRGRIEDLVCAVLRGLYNLETAHSVDHLYLLVICTLIMVQDVSLRSHLSRIQVNVPWYRERSLSEVSLTDLTILCIIRTVMHALFRLRDNYLVSNCYAVLLNLAPYIANMHSYSAERLVTVTCRLGKRISKLISSKGETTKDSIPVSGGDTELEDTFRVFLKVIAIALHPLQRASNVQLAYAMIHQSHILDSLLCNFHYVDCGISQQGSPVQTSFANALDHASDGYLDWTGSPLQLVGMVNHYLALLDKMRVQGVPTAKETISALRIEMEIRTKEYVDSNSSLQSSSGNHVLTYAFEEGETPESFFLPFSWVSMVNLLV